MQQPYTLSSVLRQMQTAIAAPSFLAGLSLGSLGTAFLAYRIYLTFYKVDDENNLGKDDDATGKNDSDCCDDGDDGGLIPTNKNRRKQLSSKKPSYRSTIFNLASFRQKGTPIDDDESSEDENFYRISFFTEVLGELWDHIKIAVAHDIRSTVEPEFRNMPAPMNSCKFIKLDLGDVPIRLDNIRVHSNGSCDTSTNNCCKWEIDIVWDGACDIRLKADYLGTFGVKELKVSGRMSVLLKPLIAEVPVVSCVQYAFCNLPEVDLSFTGIIKVANMSIVKSSIKSAIQSALVPYCLPNRRMRKISAKDGTFLEAYTPPIGILRLWIEHGNDFAIERRLLASDDIPDVYFNVSLGMDNPVWKTETVDDNCNPTWGGDIHRDFLVWDAEQLLKLHAWDEDDGPLDPDDDLGYASISVAKLLLLNKLPSKTMVWDDNKNGDRYRHKLPLVYNGEKTGATVTVSAQFGAWTPNIETMKPRHQIADHDANQKETTGVGPDTKENIRGLLVIVVNRAFHLKPIRIQETNDGIEENQNSSLPKKTAKTFVRLRFAGKKYDSDVVSVLVESIHRRLEIHPIYESAFSIPVSSLLELDDNTPIVLELIDATVNEEDNFGDDNDTSNGNSPKNSHVPVQTNASTESSTLMNSNTEVTSDSGVIGLTTITVGELNKSPDGTWIGMRQLEQSPRTGRGNRRVTFMADASGAGGAVLELKARLHGVSLQRAKQPDRASVMGQSWNSVLQRSSYQLKTMKKKESKSLTKNLPNSPTMKTPPKPNSLASISPSMRSVNEEIPDDSCDRCDSFVEPKTLNSETTTIRITVVSVRGLKAKEQMFGVEIPSSYCTLKVMDKTPANQRSDKQHPRQLQTATEVPKEFHFQTSTKYNVVHPIWNEHKHFVLPNASLGYRHGRAVEVRCELWDKDINLGRILLLGESTVTLHQLYDTRENAVASTKEFELKTLNGQSSGIFLTLECFRV